MQERAAVVKRRHKTRQGATIKLARVGSALPGVSARAMPERLVGGGSDPAVLAPCARGTLRAKIPQLEQALAERFGPHQRFLVAQHRAHSDLRDDASARWSAEVAQRLAPFADQSARSDTVTSPAAAKIAANSPGV